jgi:rubrerythrin
MEWDTLYPAFAKAAEDEGFKDIANLFKQVAKVEKYHERRYSKLLTNLEKDTPVQWYCRNCGYVHDGKAAAMKCPVCDHPQSYFELWVENY